MISTRYFLAARSNFIAIPNRFAGIRFMSSKSKTFKPSPEQKAIVKALERNNVIVSARPGSGKTATAKFVVEANRETPVLVLTYSARLRHDTRKKLQRYKKVEVYTFHAFARKIFGVPVKDDLALRALRAQKAQPVLTVPYEIIILDEIQDMTEILYWLVCTVLSASKRSLSTPPRLLILGDSRQAIYGYQTADARYLELAEDIFSDYSPLPWKSLDLPCSWRLSHQTADFVNAFIGEKYIDGSHDGPRPLYIHANTYDIRSLIETLVPIIDEYSPENCAILSPSVENNPVLARLTNVLSKGFRIPVAQPISEEGPLNPKVLKGKLVVSTYHQFKGSERDVVIIYGADASYFDRIDKLSRDDRCPNAVFVALTRAKKQLVVIQSHSQPTMPFVEWPRLMDTCEFINLANRDPKPQNQPGLPRDAPSFPSRISVTQLIKHHTSENLDRLIKDYVRIEKVTAPSSTIDIDNIVSVKKPKGHYESVGDINGVAITAAFEWKSRGTCAIIKGDVEAILAVIPPEEQARWFAEEATNYCSDPYKSREFQMRFQDFDWLDGHLTQAMTRLEEQFNNPALLAFETDVSHTLTMEGASFASESAHGTEIYGRTDIIEPSPMDGDPPTIWEIKMVSELSLEHVAQVVIYGMLRAVQNEEGEESRFPRLVLFNVRDGEKWEISSTVDAAKEFARHLLSLRYAGRPWVPDDKFLANCAQVREEVTSEVHGGGK